MINGWIYKLFCMDTREMYIGSTTNLKIRKYDHKHKQKKATVATQIINRKNYIFLILQEGKYINLDHLKAIEDNYIEKLPCINYIRIYTIRKKNPNKPTKNYYVKKPKKDLSQTKININKRIKKNCEFCKKTMSSNNISRHLITCKLNPANAPKNHR